VYKMEVSDFYENLSACPVCLNRYDRMFGYLQLQVDQLVDIECIQTRPGRIETAHKSILAFTHRIGSCNGLRCLMLSEAVRTRHYKNSLTLTRKSAQHNNSPPLLKRNWMGIDPGTVRLVAERLNHYAPQAHFRSYIIINSVTKSSQMNMFSLIFKLNLSLLGKVLDIASFVK
jgi:hypothetical protein